MPLGIDVSFKSTQHKRIIEAVRDRWRMCRDKAADRYTKWADAEDKALAYLRVSTQDALKKQKIKEGEPQYVTIDIPYSYAQMLSAHTYESTVFLSRTPIHQYSARFSASTDATQALEAIIDYQVQVGKALVPYYIWLMDKRKYGCGILGTYWDTEIQQVTEIIEQVRTFAGLPLPGVAPKKVKQIQRIKAYEGNRLYNIRPYDFIFDPRVTLGDFQRGEFAGRYVEVGWNYVARKAEDGEFQNTDELKKTRPSNWWRDQGSSNLTRPNQDGPEPISEADSDPDDPARTLGYIEICELYVELIPADWKLGSSKYPEKWLFIVGNDAVVLFAGPSGLVHGAYPYDVIENEIEGYAMFKRGMLEILQPLNDTISWLVNTHFFNVRRALNDQLIADPSRVYMKDLEDDDKGRIIRLKPTAYGQDVRTIVSQLMVADVTQQHMKDAVGIMELLQRLSGVNDNIMGMVNPGGRKTATEIRSSNTAGVTRLKVDAEYSSAQGWASHSQKLVQNTQQFYDAEQEFRIAGNLMGKAGQLVNVTPESIAGFYDFVPVDGTMPIDRFAMASLWKDLMGQMAGIPSLMMQYDLGAIFDYVANLAGVKNLQGFKLNVSPDQQLMAQMQQGNVTPIGGAGGGRGRGRRGATVPEGVGGPAPGVSGPTQIPGLGPPS